MVQRKVAVGALAGAITTVGIWALHLAFAVDPPAEVAAAVVVILTFVASWVVPAAEQA